MKFKRHTKLEGDLSQIDIVPFIDIVLLLLIFFMLLSPLTSPSGINVKLPKAVTSDITKDNIIITITGENVIYFNGKITTLKELVQTLIRPQMKGRPLLIQADRRTSVGRIVDVWNLCRKLGIEKINIATNQEN